MSSPDDRSRRRPSTNTQYVLEELRDAVVGGELTPGERVAQEEVATRLGVSVAPVREALRVLEQEGQVTYRPQRGYFVTAFQIADLEEIYGLRSLLEERAVREAMIAIDDEALERIRRAARECADAEDVRDVTAELAANRRFHFAIFEPSGRPHLIRLLGTLWDSTEAYRAMYYNSSEERRTSLRAHDHIIEAIQRHDVERLVAELNAHRERALTVLRGILPRAEATP
jgi:DNA-binding GntR family transcriptional regulator